MGGSSPEEPTPVFKSTFPELKGKEYATQEELAAAEAKVIEERQAAADKKAAEEEAARVEAERKAKQDAYNKRLTEGKNRLAETAITDPTSLATKSDVSTVATDNDQFIAAATGQAGAASTAATATTGAADAAATPDEITAKTVTPVTDATATTDAAISGSGATGTVSDAAKVTGATGTVSEDAKADAQNVDPKYIQEVIAGTRQPSSDELAKAQGMDAEAVKANIANAEVPDNIVAASTTVKGNELPQPAQIAEADMAQAEAITSAGLSTDSTMVAAKLEKFSVSSETLAEAAQGSITAQDTVQGQLSSLMQDFDDGTPAWAAGAMRAANSAMLARGMGGSTMAGAAI